MKCVSSAVGKDQNVSDDDVAGAVYDSKNGNVVRRKEALSKKDSNETLETLGSACSSSIRSVDQTTNNKYHKSQKANVAASQRKTITFAEQENQIFNIPTRHELRKTAVVNNSSCPTSVTVTQEESTTLSTSTGSLSDSNNSLWWSRTELDQVMLECQQLLRFRMAGRSVEHYNNNNNNNASNDVDNETTFRGLESLLQYTTMERRRRDSIFVVKQATRSSSSVVAQQDNNNRNASKATEILAKKLRNMSRKAVQEAIDRAQDDWKSVRSFQQGNNNNRNRKVSSIRCAVSHLLCFGKNNTSNDQNTHNHKDNSTLDSNKSSSNTKSYQ